MFAYLFLIQINTVKIEKLLVIATIVVLIYKNIRLDSIFTIR